MTYSIGFRAPPYHELGEAFLQFIADTVELPGRYADPDLRPTTHPAKIDDLMLSRVSAEIAKVQFSPEDVQIFLGEYLTEPKPHVFFNRPSRPMTLERFAQSAAKRGVALSRKTRMLYRGKHVFINGESFAAGRADKASLITLADERRLDAEAFGQVSQDVLEALHTWYLDGWVTFE